MDIAVRVQQDGKTGSNHEGFVDEVLRRVADLAAEGEYDRAALETDDALERLDAEKDRVLQQGIEVARLAGNFDRAANLIVRRLTQQKEPKGAFATIHAEVVALCSSGSEHGILSDQHIAIAVATELLTKASDPDQFGAVFGSRGIARAELAERELGTERLFQAIGDYQSALTNFSWKRRPLEWARLQMNLSNSLRILGERETGTLHLHESVSACLCALEVFSRKIEPLNWARTQINMGNALLSLGERQTDTRKYYEATKAYQAALEKLRRKSAPLEWARVQMNLGNALALLGRHRPGVKHFEQALVAYEAALLKITNERVPLHWAQTQLNIANLEILFWERTRRSDHLTNGCSYARNAMDAFKKASATHYISEAVRVLETIEGLRDEALI